MLDGLLNRNNFRTKCKTALTRTRTRLEVIKKKRGAMQKFLKKDIADLLKSNLDRNAYGRAEGLYKELNLSSCYGFVEQCCACVSDHLKEMHKQRECPEACKVAVSSLVYAAARFADLPELRDLRNQFNEKYGVSLEIFVSKELVEKLKSRPPSVEMKLQMMQEIAKEFCITWDSLHLQQQLHSTGNHNRDQHAKSNGATSKHKLLRSVSSLGKQDNGDRQINEGRTDSKLGIRRHNSYTEFTEDFTDTELQDQYSMEEGKNPNSSRRDVENNANRKPFTNRIVPAPYTRPGKAGEHGTGGKDEHRASESKEERNPNYGFGHGDPKLNLQRQKEKNDNDDLFSYAKPRPKSVRTKFLKQSVSSATTPTSNSEHETDVRESHSARAPQERRHGVFSDEDEEEEVMDKFWARNSTKRPPKTPSSARSSLPTSPELVDDATPKPELPLPPGRRRYLLSGSPQASPERQTNSDQRPSTTGRNRLPASNPESPVQPKYSPMRHKKSASSLNDGAFGRVHPKMPDFDELADRVAALKKM